MNKQLYYDSTEGMYWYEEDGQEKFYGWANEVTDAEAESAIDKIAKKEDDEIK